ncbi:MAG: two pore domain potassium channel family protein [Ardenticatenaceae bacterium]|nr:two pore domain potassium channel family protein [Anaerolineales bacterium]MCB8980189.1 two pore domain potassium channel family protein [Ardenticatenaceae bacterium]
MNINSTTHITNLSNSSENATDYADFDLTNATPHETVHKIVERFDAEAEIDEETAESMRQSFLLAIKAEPALLREQAISEFLAQSIEPEDLAKLEWESPTSMMLFSESLYHTRFSNQEMAQSMNQHASTLLHVALHQYEKEGEMEKMFRLLRLAPSYLLRQDAELGRLHYRANAYEIRRVRRSRHLLHIYLAIQVVLVLLVFPLLFINAENGRLQRQVEQLADVELGDDGYQLITFSEGVYWSIITASSIGYGDITPTTTTGRIIAGSLGTMGVITVGILAGLVLDWITPRRIL